MIIDSPTRIRYYAGESVVFESPHPSSGDNISPHIEWLDPEGPHAVENIDNRSYPALRIELKAGK